MTDDNEDFAAMLAEFETSSPGRGPKVGDVVKGTVVSIGAESVFVDLGAKSEGVLGRDQVVDADGELQIKVGDEIEARVVEAGGKSGSIVLRTKVGRGPEAQAELVAAFEHRMPVEGVVSSVNKGGVEVQLAGLRAFCPMSQLDNRFVEDAEAYVGQRLSFRITKLDAGRGGRPDVVLSRRALLEEESRRLAAEARKTLEVGKVVSGVVKTLKPYGAFVDIGGLEGMLHISEIGFSRVEDPSEVLAEGQQIEVKIIKIEKTGDEKRPEKIALSLKALADDPWGDASARFAPGKKVKGTVVRLQPFGAFVEIAPAVEGLVHISELGQSKRIHHPREVLKVGQVVDVTILNVEVGKRRIGLSLKEGAEASEDASLRGHQDENQSMGTFADLLKNR